jgi:hypothetical protein
MRVLIRWAGFMAAVLVVSSLVRRARAFEPTDAYEERRMHGFTILVSRDALKHPRELDAAMTELDAQLGRIVDVVGPEPLAGLRKIRMWVEWRSPLNHTAEFHPSAAWLKVNGYNPEKAGCVEIGDITRFVAWSRG